MIITIKGADFSAKNIGTLSTWTILTSLGSGATYDGNRLVDKGSSLSATITIADGYELGSAGVSVIMGGTDVTSSAATVNGNIITISIATVTGNVTINVPTLNTDTGEEEGGETPTDSKVLLSNYRSETGTTLSANSYTTSAKDTHVTFFDIPINPSEVYYVSWGIRAWFLTSDKTPISTINFHSASNVNKPQYVFTPSTAAYMTVSLSSTREGYSLPDAYIQEALLEFTATNTELINETGATYLVDKGLNTASYLVEDKVGSWIYEYIPVAANTIYRAEGGVRSWFLNASKNPISTVNILNNNPKFTFTTPANAAYISITFSNKQWTNEKTAVNLEEGIFNCNLI